MTKTTSNPWTDLLTDEELEARHALTAKLDPCFAKQARFFWENRTDDDLRVLEWQALQCGDADQYQLARTYAARLLKRRGAGQ